MKMALLTLMMLAGLLCSLDTPYNSLHIVDNHTHSDENTVLNVLT